MFCAIFNFQTRSNYMVNVNELKNWVDITDEDDDDDID